MSPESGELTGSAVQSANALLQVLIKTLSALGLGFVCVRHGFVDPRRGDMQGMQFFIGKLALPLAVFRIVATADVGSVDLGVIAACTLGKVAVFVLTFGMAFCAYRSKDAFHRRILTAAVMGFFTTASNDLAIGFPVVSAIYGEEMLVYLTANVLVFQTVLQPLVLVLFEVGEALGVGSGSPQSGRTPEQQWRGLAAQTAKRIALNPIMLATVLGAAYSSILGSTLVASATGGLELPPPFGGIIELWTSPFTMMFLFMNGTALRSASIGLWPALLVLMKVLVCAYLSYCLSYLFVDRDSHKAQTLRDFTFFYGTLPAGGAPLIYAQLFDCGVDIVASASILCLALAGPIEFVTALFLGSSDGSVNYYDVHIVMRGAAQASAACSGIIVLFVCLGWWGATPLSRAIGAFSCATFLYEVWTLLIMGDPSGGCSLQGNVLFIYRVLQNACYALVVYIQYQLGARWQGGDGIGSGAMAAAVLLAAVLPAIVVPYGNALHEMCGVDLQPRESGILVTWNSVLFAVILALSIWGRLLKQRRYDLLTAQLQKDTGLALTPLLDLGEAEGPSSPGDDEGVGVGTCLVLVQGLRSLMGAVNGFAQVLTTDPQVNDQGFTPMLILENIAEHGQGCLLLVAVFFQPSILARIHKLILNLGDWGCWQGVPVEVEPLHQLFAERESRRYMSQDDGCSSRGASHGSISPWTRAMLSRAVSM